CYSRKWTRRISTTHPHVGAEAMQMNMLRSVLVRLAQAAHAICLWLSGLRAKQGMLHLLAHEVRPCLIYGEFSEVGRRAVSSLQRPRPIIPICRYLTLRLVADSLPRLF